MLKDLATLTRNLTQMGDTEITFERYAEPTPLQRRAFELLDVSYRLWAKVPSAPHLTIRREPFSQAASS